MRQKSNYLRRAIVKHPIAYTNVMNDMSQCRQLQSLKYCIKWELTKTIVSFIVFLTAQDLVSSARVAQLSVTANIFHFHCHHISRL